MNQQERGGEQQALFGNHKRHCLEIVSRKPQGVLLVPQWMPATFQPAESSYGSSPGKSLPELPAKFHSHLWDVGHPLQDYITALKGNSYSCRGFLRCHDFFLVAPSCVHSVALLWNPSSLSQFQEFYLPSSVTRHVLKHSSSWGLVNRRQEQASTFPQRTSLKCILLERPVSPMLRRWTHLTLGAPPLRTRHISTTGWERKL